MSTYGPKGRTREPLFQDSRELETEAGGRGNSRQDGIIRSHAKGLTAMYTAVWTQRTVCPGHGMFGSSHLRGMVHAAQQARRGLLGRWDILALLGGLLV